MAAGESADEVIEVVAVVVGLSELGGDADGERVAADIGKVFAEQPSCTVASPAVRTTSM